MNQIPRTLYTKCFKFELTQRSHTLGDSGLSKKYFYENTKRLIEHCYLREDETIIKVDIYAFADPCQWFKQFDNEIWENNSPLLTQYISEV
ncbi:MAG: hypothetical protein ACH350_10300 [Parachlamydiaceae bacterium]